MEHIPEVFWILLGAGFTLWGLSRLSEGDTLEILTSIKPPYNYGPVIFRYTGEEE